MICELCQREVDQYTRHHLIPKSRNKKSTELLVLCKACHGMIHRIFDNKELEDAINKVISGGTYFSQELLLNLIKNKTFDENIVLTKREKEVLELICKGYSNQQISEQLFISQRTVERHRSSLLLKTDSKNSISLVIFAIKHKLISI